MIEQTFRAAKNPERAEKMAKYMRNQFDFLGLDTPTRQALSKDWLKEKTQAKAIDWALVKQLWDLPEREFQYLACDYLKKMKKELTAAALPAIAALAQSKSWWDTVDSLDERVGDIVQKAAQTKTEMLVWSQSDNIWLRRLAIDYQLAFKEKTDKELLSSIIQNNFGETEFFINKAIGWALRQYSKVNPDWVREFIEIYKGQLDRLTIREASKYL